MVRAIVRPGYGLQAFQPTSKRFLLEPPCLLSLKHALDGFVLLSHKATVY